MVLPFILSILMQLQNFIKIHQFGPQDIEHKRNFQHQSRALLKMKKKYSSIIQTYILSISMHIQNLIEICKLIHKILSINKILTLIKGHNSFNQRTSGPVNAHLTPGPGIYFNAFIHVYSPRAGADNPVGTNVDVNKKPLSFCLFVAGLKKNCFEVLIFIYIFFMFHHMSHLMTKPKKWHVHPVKTQIGLGIQPV